MTENGAAPEPDAGFGEGLINEIFTVWVEPELNRRGLNLARGAVTAVTVELDPSLPSPIIKINDEAKIIASVRTTRAIKAGAPITEADFDEVKGVKPAELGPDSGWVCFAVIRGQSVIAFDFRYNRSQALRLVERAREFLAAARRAATEAPAVAYDTGFSAAELAVQAQMLLQEQKTKAHWVRQGWIDSWTRLENAPGSHAVALRELHEHRASARYADQDLTFAQGRLAALLDIAEEMINEAERITSAGFPPIDL